MNHAELLTALKAATGPDRELDADLATYLGYPVIWKQANGTMDVFPVWKGPLGKEPCPRFTDSIDAALALVQEKLPPRDGWRFNIVDIGEERVGFEVHKPEWPGSHYEDAPTAPLAILIALLTALEEQE